MSAENMEGVPIGEGETGSQEQLGIQLEDADKLLNEGLIKFDSEAKRKIKQFVLEHPEYYNQDMLLTFTKCITAFEDPRDAIDVGRDIGDIVHYTQDKESFIKSVGAINDFKDEPDVAISVAEGLSSVALYTKDKEVVLKSAEAITAFKGQKPDVVKVVADGLGVVAETRDKEAVLFLAEKYTK